MTKNLGIIILSLTLAFSLILTIGCQKAKENAEVAKEKATETTAEIKEEVSETMEEAKLRKK
jgi:hypothetical protein